MTRDPKNQGARFLKALALANSTKLDEARTELDSLLKDAPNSLIAKLAKARLDLIQKHLPEAEKQFSDLYKAGQPDLRPLDGLLATYIAENQPAKGNGSCGEGARRLPGQAGVGCPPGGIERQHG